MPGAGAILVGLRRSQAVHERAGLAAYEPEYDPEGLTIEAAIELAACITRSPWPGSVLSGVEAVARAEDRAQHLPLSPVAAGQGLDQAVVLGLVSPVVTVKAPDGISVPSTADADHRPRRTHSWPYTPLAMKARAALQPDHADVVRPLT